VIVHPEQMNVKDGKCFPKIYLCCQTNQTYMKKICLILLAAATGLAAHSQTVFEGYYTYKKMARPAAKMELAYPKSQVEDGLANYMGKRGYKPASASGMTVYRRVTLDSILADLYFDFDKQGKGEGQTTTMTLVTTKANQPLDSLKANDKAMLEAARKFLTGLLGPIAEYEHGVKVTAQTEVLQDARKKLDKLIEQQNSLQKKIRDAQADLADNKTEQAQAQLSKDNPDAKTAEKARDRLQKLLSKQSKLEDSIKQYELDLAKNQSDQEVQKAEVKKQEDALAALQAAK
jgi:exonuclease VII small subunit